MVFRWNMFCQCFSVNAFFSQTVLCYCYHEKAFLWCSPHITKWDIKFSWSLRLFLKVLTWYRYINKIQNNYQNIQADQKEGYSSNAFFYFLRRTKYVTRNKKIQFVYLTEAVIKVVLNAIFYMKKNNLDESCNWTGKIQVTLLLPLRKK